MAKYNYRLLQPNDDYKLAKLEKTGITAEFTLLEVEGMQARNEKAKREVEGQMKIDRATMVNVEGHYEFVKTLSDRELVAAALYQESKASVAECEKKLVQIESAIKENDEMIEQVMSVLGLQKSDITPKPQSDGKTTGEN